MSRFGVFCDDKVAVVVMMLMMMMPEARRQGVTLWYLLVTMAQNCRKPDDHPRRAGHPISARAWAHARLVADICVQTNHLTFTHTTAPGRCA